MKQKCSTRFRRELHGLTPFSLNEKPLISYSLHTAEIWCILLPSSYGIVAPVEPRVDEVVAKVSHEHQ